MTVRDLPTVFAPSVAFIEPACGPGTDDVVTANGPLFSDAAGMNTLG